MDMNMIVVCGRLAAPPELREFESGSRLMRMLVTVRSETPRRRVDVLPVTLWDPPADLTEQDLHPGIGIWATGSIQRRFWESAEGRISRLEIVATQITVSETETVGAEQ